jgi:glucose/arabinose dehydrogenase
LLLGLLSACATPNNLEAVGPPQGIGGQADLLDQFEDTLVAKVANPTALAFTPDGRLLIATQSGQLRVHQNGALRSTPALNLGPRLCTNGERGLLGLAVDPDFATTGYVYLFYTFDKDGTGTCARSLKGTAVNRVSRFTMSGNSASLSSERILINNIPAPFGNHHSGDLQMGKDGLLHISVGDGGCDYRGDSACGGENDAARDQHTLLGKVLRVTRLALYPEATPFRCQQRTLQHGNVSPGKVCQETYASGCANPFRLAFDPNASSTKVLHQ